MSEQGAEERTEQATPRWRREHRERGEVARSREVSSVAILLGGVALLYFSAPAIYAGLTGLLRFCLGEAVRRPVTASSAAALFSAAPRRPAGGVGAGAGGMVVVALAASYGQVGLMLAPQAIRPKLSNLDPIRGLKRMFSMKAIARLAFSLLKLAIIVAVFTLAIRSRLPQFFPLVHAPASGVFVYLWRTVALVAFQVCAVLVVVALADYAYQRWSFERGIRMTRQELREELKRTEGDPTVKARIRQVQRLAAQRRMMHDVPKADVVVTNPAHYAVALRYKPDEMDAPVCVAKGREWLAEKIKEVARRHGVPIVEDPVLARALYRHVEIGRAIPMALYRAVARLISYVYQLRRRQPTRYAPLAEAPEVGRGRRGATRDATRDA